MIWRVRRVLTGHDGWGEYRSRPRTAIGRECRVARGTTRRGGAEMAAML